MPIIDAVILGFVQGATEFIPVSSSAHLILAREFLGVSPGLYDLAFDAVLQLASVLAVIAFFWQDLYEMGKGFFRYLYQRVKEAKVRNSEVSVTEPTRLAFAVIVGTIPAVLLGVLLESYMESAFRSAYVIIFTLILGALLLLFADKNTSNENQIPVNKGFWIGFFQALALLPGMSRSGSTIAGGRFLGLSREAATKFSFLLSIPILFGAGLKKLYEIAPVIFLDNPAIREISYQSVMISTGVSFLVSIIAIKFLLKYVSSRPLSIFVLYRIALAVLLFVWVYASEAILGIVR